MFLLAILLSLALERLIPALDGLRSLVWFGHFTTWIRARVQGGAGRRGTLAVLLIILTPTLAVAGIQALLDQVLWLFSFALSLAVLVYALGPRDLHRQVSAFLDALQHGDPTGAQAAVRDLLPSPPPEDHEGLCQAVVDATLVQTHERVLAVFFWFVLLGPMGAILYRLGAELVAAPRDADTDFWRTADLLHQLLAWLPAHLTALSFGAMGSFVHALQAWREDGMRRLSNHPLCHQFIIRTGRAAMDLERVGGGVDAIRETLGLCRRSLIAWVTILALLTLAGWVV